MSDRKKTEKIERRDTRLWRQPQEGEGFCWRDGVVQADCGTKCRICGAQLAANRGTIQDRIQEIEYANAFLPKEGEPLPAQDWATVLGVLDDIQAGRPRSFADAGLAHEAAERLKKKHQRYLDACARVTELANKLHARLAYDDVGVTADPDQIREALGEAYLGGLLM